MNQFPPLTEQLFWIAILAFLSILCFRYIKKKQLFLITTQAQVPIYFKDLFLNIGFYFIAFYIAIFSLKFFPNLFPRVFIEKAAVVNFLNQTLFLALITGFLGFKKIYLIKKFSHFFESILLVLKYLLVIFPVVSLIGQVCDTLLYVLFDVRGYDQVAVAFLKSSLNYPFALVLLMISIVILAPLVEEYFFRGIVLNAFKNRFGTWPGILISAIAFSLMHFDFSQGLGNFSLLCALLFFGIILGIFYVRSQNLLYPILLHGIFNLLSGLRILFFDV